MSADSVVDPLGPGDPPTLGTYRLLGRIGRGGMGTVYLAESEVGQRAAIKVINPDLADDPSFRDRFRREVESARRVRRFCTAPVLDAQLDGAPLFIVTEYVNGPNLDEFVRGSGPMRGSTLDHLAVGVATALTAIHGAGVVHRDLKPANVLLSSLGPRVIDFGIARALDSAADATRTGHFIGTPAYMAPEIIEGERATPASDVFAWGAVVAFAGTGESPFPANTVPAVLYRITHGEPQTDGLDEEVRQLVESALIKDPTRRPSAQELLDGLVGQERADTAQTAARVRRTWQAHSLPERNLTISDPFPRTGRESATLVAARPDPPTLREPATADGPPGPPRPGRRAVSVTAAWAAGVLTLILVTVAAVALVLKDSGGPPRATTTLFSDDFSNPSTHWPGGVYTSGYGYFDGRYRLETAGAETEESSPAPYEQSLPARALVSSDVTVASGPPYGQLGLWCFGPDSGTVDGYLFLVRLDGNGTVVRKVSGHNISKQLAHSAHAKGFRTTGANRVQIACERQGTTVRLRLWLNGRLAAECADADNPLTEGQAGVIVRRDGGGSGGEVVADFDNFDVSSID
ncbi:MAG: serine/threonine protein kinase [Streptosporangiaceae bacterium]|nr:serine/threonine protein kinase [Streptosporangiaceae bacterium]